jgi:hypothetical protein
MLPEPNEKTQSTEYPTNLFEESRDHANQWDVSTLWPDHKTMPGDQKEAKQAKTSEAE